MGTRVDKNDIVSDFFMHFYFFNKAVIFCKLDAIWGCCVLGNKGVARHFSEGQVLLN